VIVGVFLRHAFADHERQERVVRDSSLAWTIVRPPHLKDGPRTGQYQHGFPPTYRRIRAQISRADVADFMLRQLADDTYLRRTSGISYLRETNSFQKGTLVARRNHSEHR
jgi:uncharacterized protein YbjT (DUF2867 family)